MNRCLVIMQWSGSNVLGPVLGPLDVASMVKATESKANVSCVPLWPSLIVLLL